MAQRDSIIIPITLMVSGGGSEIDAAAQSPTGQNEKQTNTQDENQKKAGQNAAGENNAAKAIASKVAGQTLSLALEGYGDVTGNYVAGNNLQVAINEGSKLAAAVSLGGVGLALYAVDKGVEAFRYASNLKKSETQAKFAQKRVYGTTVKS